MGIEPSELDLLDDRLAPLEALLLAIARRGEPGGRDRGRAELTGGDAGWTSALTPGCETKYHSAPSGRASPAWRVLP